MSFIEPLILIYPSPDNISEENEFSEFPLSITSKAVRRKSLSMLFTSDFLLCN